MIQSYTEEECACLYPCISGFVFVAALYVGTIVGWDMNDPKPTPAVVIPQDKIQNVYEENGTDCYQYVCYPEQT